MEKMLHIGNNKRSYLVIMSLSILALIILTIQTVVFPTLLVDDTVDLANHYLKYQFEHKDEFSNPVLFPSYAGALTYFGVLVWWGGGIICLFTAALLTPKTSGRIYLFFIGIITLTCAADDLFRIHENVHWLNFELIYAAGTILPIILCRKWLLTQPLIPLVIALLFFGCSVTVDGIIKMKFLSIQNRAMLEEGTKLLGIISWTFFHTYLAASTLRKSGSLQDQSSQ